MYVVSPGQRRNTIANVRTFIVRQNENRDIEIFLHVLVGMLTLEVFSVGQFSHDYIVTVFMDRHAARQ